MTNQNIKPSRGTPEFLSWLAGNFAGPQRYALDCEELENELRLLINNSETAGDLLKELHSIGVEHTNANFLGVLDVFKKLFIKQHVPLADDYLLKQTVAGQRLLELGYSKQLFYPPSNPQ